MNGERACVDGCEVGAPEDQLVFGTLCASCCLCNSGDQAITNWTAANPSELVADAPIAGSATDTDTVVFNEAPRVHRWVCVWFFFFLLFLHLQTFSLED